MHFNDVVTYMYNCTFCDFIAHLTFQMRMVLVTRNSNQTIRRSPLRGRGRLGMRLQKSPNTIGRCRKVKWEAMLVTAVGRT